jgi:hypothetical protein
MKASVTYTVDLVNAAWLRDQAKEETLPPASTVVNRLIELVRTGKVPVAAVQG